MQLVLVVCLLVVQLVLVVCLPVQLALVACLVVPLRALVVPKLLSREALLAHPSCQLVVKVLQKQQRPQSALVPPRAVFHRPAAAYWVVAEVPGPLGKLTQKRLDVAD